MQFAESMEINYIKASEGWLGKFLKQYGWNSLDIHGETDEISDEDFNKTFQRWTEKILEKKSRY